MNDPTPGRLTIHLRQPGFALVLDGDEVGTVASYEHAARLAACWNFCAGLSTDTLEAVPNLNKLVADAVARATAALVSACEAALRQSSRLPLDLADDWIETRDQLRAALARPEKGETP